jgi:hypothetical protein
MTLSKAIPYAVEHGKKIKRPDWAYSLQFIDGQLRISDLYGRHWFDYKDLIAKDYIVIW